MKEGASLRAPTIDRKFFKSVRPRQELRGFGSGGYRPVAYDSNRWNEEQALRSRVLVETPRIDEQFVRDRIRWLKRNHEKIFPSVHRVESAAFSTYLKNSNASPSVKAILQKTYDRLQSEGITQFSQLTKAQIKQWTTRKAFIKTEHLLYRTPAGYKNRAPRMIQGAPPEFIVLLGPWFAALQSRIKKRWGLDNFICFTSGVKARDSAAKLFEVVGSFLEDDIGTFDASVGKLWLQYEVWLSKRFGAPRAVLDLQRANILTRGVTSNGWVYRVDGGRKSGDPFTSLYNSILNGCMHLSLYNHYTGKTVAMIRESLRMLVCGDDNAMVHTESEHFPWVADMARFGFASEALYRSKPHFVEFCSNRLTPTSQGWTFVPKPGKVMSKLGYFIDPPKDVSNHSLLRGTALGLIKACSPSPPLTAYLNRILDITKTAPDWSPPVEEWKLEYDYSSPSIDTWAALYDVYGWDVERQRLFEADLAELDFGDEFVTPLARSLYDADTAGPRDIFSPVSVY